MHLSIVASFFSKLAIPVVAEAVSAFYFSLNVLSSFKASDFIH